MQEKIIHIPFTRSFYIDSQKRIWSAAVNKVIQRYIIYTLMGLVFGTTVLLDNSVQDVTLARAITGGFTFYMLIAWIGFFERRAKFLKMAKQHADRYEKESLDGVFTFSDAGMQYQDKEKTLQFQWHLLKSVTTVKDNVVIAMKDPAVLTFFISRPQLGDEVFNELLEFLQGQVKK